MKPHFIKNPLKPLDVKTGLLLIGDCNVKQAAAKLIKADTTVVGYSDNIRTVTDCNTIHAALVHATLFGLLPYAQVIDTIRPEWQPFIKLVPKQNT
ncbi:MAG: hypothetical protein AB7G44_01205 [Bacteroidia bacterium]